MPDPTQSGEGSECALKNKAVSAIERIINEMGGATSAARILAAGTMPGRAAPAQQRISSWLSRCWGSPANFETLMLFAPDGVTITDLLMDEMIAQAKEAGASDREVCAAVVRAHQIRLDALGDLSDIMRRRSRVAREELEDVEHKLKQTVLRIGSDAVTSRKLKERVALRQELLRTAESSSAAVTRAIGRATALLDAAKARHAMSQITAAGPE